MGKICSKEECTGTLMVDGEDEIFELSSKINNTLDKLNNERNSANEANEDKTKFLIRMSHEIRTPLNALMGMPELLSEADLDENQKKFLDIFQKSGRTMLNVIDDILEIVSLDSGRIFLERTKFSLSGTLNELKEKFKPLANAKGLGFDIRVAPQVPEDVIGDSKRLKQAISILMDNAIKFTQKGQVALQVEVSADKNELLFIVWDTGVGIDSGKHDMILKSFTQIVPPGMGEVPAMEWGWL